MKFRYWILLVIVFSFGCTTSNPVAPTVTPPPPEPTPTLPDPGVQVISPPDPEEAVRAYLDSWIEDDYAAMYALLTSESQKQISQEEFEKLYLEVVSTAAVREGDIDYQVIDSFVQPRQAKVNYRVTLHSVIAGEITRQTDMSLNLEGDSWGVIWDKSLILTELAEGKTLRMVNYVPERGDIFDRNGEVLVAKSDAYALGIVPAGIDPEREENMLGLLSRVTGFPGEYISTFYVDYGPDADFYVPFTDVSAQALDPFYDAVAGYDATVITPFSGRYYFDGGPASQVVGYVSAIQPEEVDTYRRQGYQWTERVGRMGLEAWGEPYLGGKRGGALFLDNPDGTTSVVLGETPAQPAQTITTTLDMNLQIQAQKALFGFRGAIVVLERDTGRVLAMASSPGFNPNLFEPTNFNSRYLLQEVLSDPSIPLLNRAAQGQYPLGSVFKIITLAAALESGVFTPESTYDCQHAFTELGSPILYDWTYWDEEDPSGVLNLLEGLMRSCNPWFFHIGLELFKQGLGSAITDMAQGFGLGSPTGIGQLQEEAGQIREPTSPLEATNQAVGQGDILVTPLQVAAFVAAVGNGGTLYRPQVVEQILDVSGETTFAFEPQVNGTLPISSQTLESIQTAMNMVVRNRRGTAYHVVNRLSLPMAGKTGTAETSGDQDPHAWFVTYTEAGREDLSDIAVVAVVENVGEGADFAAPIVRRVLEVYYSGSPRSIYPWEDRIGVPDFLTPEEEPSEENGEG